MALDKFLFITLLTFAQARPDSVSFSLWEPHDGCPPAQYHYLLPHEYDCTKFYYCEYGMKYIEPRICAPGTEFSYALQVCIMPSLANCTLPGVPPTDTTTQLPTTTTTTTTPTTTTTTTPTTTTTTTPTTTTTTTPTTTTTTPTTTTTTTPTTTTTTTPTTTTTTTPTTTTTTTPTTTTTTTPTTTTTTTTSTTTQASTTEEDCEFFDNGCPTDFDVHKLLPHETNCSRFYYCVFGEKVERECAPGTYFNYDKQVCDWPHNVNCTNSGDGNGDGDGGNGDGGNGDGGNGDGGSGGGDEDCDEYLPNGCPADFDIHYLLPHENDCEKFYQCVHGNLVERLCAPGTHFNAALQVCDWPQNAGCENSGGCTGCPDGGDGDSGDGGGGNGDGDSGNGGGDGGNGGGDGGNGGGDGGDEDCDEYLPNGCPADFDVHYLLPHENDCEKFYQCVHGNLVERLCAPGTHFNAALQVCDWPQNAGCETGGGCTGCPGGGDGDNGGGDGGNGGGDSGSGGGNPELLPNGCPSDFDVHQLLPHESNCSRFYQCVFGETVERECAPGTHFNAVMQICDWPANAGCETIGGGCNGGDDNDDNDDNESTCPESGDDGSNEGGDDGNGGDENGEDGDDGNEGGCAGCPGGGDLLPNGCPSNFSVELLLPHEDCGKFYQCVHGDKIEMKCAEGTHFNPVAQICDWPADAGCEAPGSGVNPDGENPDAENPDCENPDGEIIS
ncbi:hypothetical protein K1T71_014074 [Dendrolimus kikuchii]|uniref:Uncharacterized protein n=1 Tax=Dendrolimus kikuchii TaxID=765133 RepID=A0ACC1CEZ6_9NEOP|nr:hypothetical protein K1T71_014074 [Dendrolimus kikuchii]